MITEREGYHSRIFERRLKDLGAECKAGLTDFGRQVTEKLSDPKTSDNDKLLYITSLAPDPEAFWKPVSEVVERIKDDQESKEFFKLYIQDELSSGKWLMYACEALNGSDKVPSAQQVFRRARLSSPTQSGPGCYPSAPVLTGNSHTHSQRLGALLRCRGAAVSPLETEHSRRRGEMKKIWFHC